MVNITYVRQYLPGLKRTDRLYPCIQYRYGLVTGGTTADDATINTAGTDMIVTQDGGTLAGEIPPFSTLTE
jgi:hypothetical protein